MTKKLVAPTKSNVINSSWNPNGKVSARHTKPIDEPYMKVLWVNFLLKAMWVNFSLTVKAKKDDFLTTYRVVGETKFWNVSSENIWVVIVHSAI